MSNNLRDEIFELIRVIKGSSSYSDQQSSTFKLTDLLKSPDCSAEIINEVAQLNVAMAVNSALAENSKISEESLALLCQNATYRWEWRSLNSAYDKKNIDAEEYLKIFNNVQVNIKDSGHFIKAICDKLAIILWQELSSQGLISFYYYPDVSEGDHFGPRDFDFDMSAAEYLLSPGYFVDWVNKKDFVEVDIIIDRLEDEWETFDSKINLIGALGHGVNSGHLKEIDESIYQEIFEEIEVMSDMEAQFSYSEVTPNAEKVRENLALANYASLKDSIKHAIVESLVDTLKHPFLGGFKISHHLLRLLHLHPATPKESKALIALHQ